MRNKLGKTILKNNLPSKICLHCKKAFTWRKKWDKCWDDVKFCSNKCRKIKN
ncbi:MAG: DUF2256 domain-containing protein [Sphingobacteriales bacterium]|nr:MAG: DUF2256 domain-containing protein [Sphingobacteriales bacterium]TAF78778.1 MAG: DUF2256 domain-containing protein [Sphingobacteriales bacterium]